MLGRSQVIVIKTSVVDFVSLNIKGRWRSEGSGTVAGEALEGVVDSALASLTGSGSPHHTSGPVNHASIALCIVKMMCIEYNYGKTL